MKQRVVRIVYLFAFYTGVMRLFYWLNRHRQVVITYHNVLPDDLFDDTLHLGVSCTASAFDAQLRIIRERFALSTQPGEPGTCLVTFDDGYDNNAIVAAPLLKKHGVPAIFFVPACASECDEPLWTDRMLRWISYVQPGTYVLAGVQFQITDGHSRFLAWLRIWQILMNNYSSRQRLLDDMHNACPPDKLPFDRRMDPLRFRLMSKDQIEQLKQQGHLIGAHSAFHNILSRLSDEELDHDFTACERRLGSLYNASLFSYPYGGHAEVTQREIDRCARSKFRYAFLNIPHTAGDHAIGRISLRNTTDKIDIHATLCGFEHSLKKLLRR